MKINIYQGTQNKLPYANVNIIIDVIRAFTVSFYAFCSNVNKIQLVDSIDRALEFKKKSEKYILSGETLGYKIKKFDYGNSPYAISNLNLEDKVLIQKTTNGVVATLNSLDADNIFVTGFVNYSSIIKKVKELSLSYKSDGFIINIIASHPTGDDDLACAELFKNILLNESLDIKSLEEKTISRILNSNASQKFLDDKNQDFFLLDLILCINPIQSNFVMSVKDVKNGLPIIYKEENKC